MLLRDFEVEIVVAVVSVFVVVAAIRARTFGAGGTLALLGIVMVVHRAAWTLHGRRRAKKDAA